MSFSLDIERKSSSSTTLCSPSIQGLQKASTVSSRRSSTPLADRFMSCNFPLKEEEEKIIIEMEADNNTPEYNSSQHLLIMNLPPPLLEQTAEASEVAAAVDSIIQPLTQEEEEDHLPLKKPPPQQQQQQQQQKKKPHKCRSHKNISTTNTNTNTTTSSTSQHKCSKTHNPMWDKKKKRTHPNRVHQPTLNQSMNELEALPQPWLRGGCCFIRNKQQGGRCFWFCGRREWVMITFLSVILSVVLAFILWPRTPLIRIEGAKMTSPNKVTQTTHGMMMSNVAFESVWLLNITMDNRRNYLSTRFNRIQIIAKDALTGLLIAKGEPDNNDIYLQGHTISTIQLPISVNYQARDRSDTTFSNLQRACTNTTTEIQHHSLSIQFWFTLYIFGLDWLGYKPSVIATPATGGFFCPF